MENTELRLLAKVLDDGNLRPLLDAKINSRHFKTIHGQTLFALISDYYNSRLTNGQVPTRDYVLRQRPTLHLPLPTRASIESLLEEFKTESIRIELIGLADYINDNIDDIPKVLNNIGSVHQVLSRETRISEDLILSDSINDARDEYERLKNLDGYSGIPFPWTALNEETGGMQNGDFIVLYGRPKSMKTFCLLACACHAYDMAHRRVLICTREMKPEQILNRCICILIRAPYYEFVHQKLHTIPVPEGGTMEDRFRKMAKIVKDDEELCSLEIGHNKTLIITSDRLDPHGGGVRSLRQKVQDHKPDTLYVDAMYLMKDDEEQKRSVKWHNQAAISTGLRNLALDFNIPIMGTNQATRDSEEKQGKSVANISFADNYGQDCTLAIEIIKRPSPEPYLNDLVMSVTASRETTLAGFAIHGNAATSFDCIMVPKYVRGEVQKNEKGDTIMTPLIFRDYRDMREFFKEPSPDKRGSKADPNLARMAFEIAGRERNKHA